MVNGGWMVTTMRFSFSSWKCWVTCHGCLWSGGGGMVLPFRKSHAGSGWMNWGSSVSIRATTRPFRPLKHAEHGIGDKSKWEWWLSGSGASIVGPSIPPSIMYGGTHSGTPCPSPMSSPSAITGIVAFRRIIPFPLQRCHGGWIRCYCNRWRGLTLLQSTEWQSIRFTVATPSTFGTLFPTGKTILSFRRQCLSFPAFGCSSQRSNILGGTAEAVQSLYASSPSFFPFSVFVSFSYLFSCGRIYLFSCFK